MATPIGHALAGYAVLGLVPAGPDRVATVVVAVALANVPDLDFLPGLLVGTPALYHQGISHSLGAAAVVGLLTALGLRRLDLPFGRVWAVSVLAYASHLALDALGPDARPPYGQPLLWPLTDARFASPLTLLPGVQHAAETSASTLAWIRGILHPANLFAIAVEVLVLSPFAYGAWRRRQARRPARRAAGHDSHRPAALQDAQP
ncbi:MAG TPA: metal-dependent hydrolase [Candidatus Binatia bacterium]|nr:metal-dependent hydrolase [Candidatus Binatia bacterium]